jgi:hypothetical protein
MFKEAMDAMMQWYAMHSDLVLHFPYLCVLPKTLHLKNLVQFLEYFIANIETIVKLVLIL